MHYGLVLLILALGTFVFFPRLAKALVGLALVGCLIVAGIVGYQLATSQSPEEQVRQQSETARLMVLASQQVGQPVPAEIQAHADYAFVTQRHDAGLDRDREPSVDELHCVVYGQERPMTEATRGACRTAVLQIEASSAPPAPAPRALPASAPPARARRALVP